MQTSATQQLLHCVFLQTAILGRRGPAHQWRQTPQQTHTFSLLCGDKHCLLSCLACSAACCSSQLLRASQLWSHGQQYKGCNCMRCRGPPRAIFPQLLLLLLHERMCAEAVLLSVAKGTCIPLGWACARRLPKATRRHMCFCVAQALLTPHTPHLTPYRVCTLNQATLKGWSQTQRASPCPAYACVVRTHMTNGQRLVMIPSCSAAHACIRYVAIHLFATCLFSCRQCHCAGYGGLDPE